MKVFWVMVVSSVFRTQNGRTQRSHAVPKHVLIPQDLFDDGPPDRLQQGLFQQLQRTGQRDLQRGPAVHQLSGGEKAFVAIALYFAILKLRPTPFCVLDEIEAALDDVNVARFAQYIRRLTDSTQFIVITHRRGTMEEADMLYGVTMQEQGVSRMLMLNLAEAEKQLGKVIR